MADTDLLAEAVQRLDQAVTRLFGPTLTEHGPTTSLWGQMVGLKFEKGQGGARGVFESTAAAQIDALDWCNTVETTVRGWAGIRDDPQTILDGWCHVNAWRPQDADVCESYASTVHDWCRKAERMLTGGSVMEMPDVPCPRCEKTFYYDQNQYSETVKKHALEVTTTEAACRICGSTWEPLFLARLVNPENVKELLTTEETS